MFQINIKNVHIEGSTFIATITIVAVLTLSLVFAFN